MATTSLWTDELYSIVNFSARGPVATVTDYHVPNNHILFNLLNSLTPGRASVDPLRARLYSLLAVSVLLTLCVIRFWRTGDFLSGALLFQIFAVNREFLDLTLQARGYGLTALLAFLMALLTLRLLERPGRGALLSLAVLTVLGGWTVPTFGLFAVPLMVTLALITRRRDVLAGAGVAAFGLLGVYAPVWRHLLYHALTFGTEWGRQYESITAVLVTLKTYLLAESALGVGVTDVGVLAFGLGVAGAAACLRASGDADVRAARVVLLAVATFFLVCLGLQFPLIRATAFVVAPLAVAVALLLRAGLRRGVGPIGPAALAVVAAAQFVPLNVKAASAFTFVPLEDWKGLGQVIAETFPPGIPLGVAGEPQFLRGYLNRSHAITDRVDPTAVGRGEQVGVLVESRQGRLDTPAGLAGAVAFRLPQRRAGPVLWFSPPPRCRLETVLTPVGSDLRSRLCDHDLETDATSATGGSGQPQRVLRLGLDPGRRYRALVLVGDDLADKSRRLRVQLRGASGTPLPLGPVRGDGRVTLLSLGDQQGSLIELEWFPGAGGDALALQEAWAYALD
jgi:hypothetical protein